MQADSSRAPLLASRAVRTDLGMAGRRARVGFTGHQRLTPESEKLVGAAVREALIVQPEFEGICSLAEGSDQIFAETALGLGGQLIAIIPCDGYEEAFTSSDEVTSFRRLLARAKRTVKLDYREPSEEAFWAAGRRMVQESESVLAVWDGLPSGGLGGTADVVGYAREQGKHVVVIWPPGAARR